MECAQEMMLTRKTQGVKRARAEKRRWKSEHDDRFPLASSRLTANHEPLDQGLGKPCVAHAILNRGDVIRNPPELNGLMLEIGDGKAGARVAVARLADGSGI